jgi:hypothetical protein
MFKRCCEAYIRKINRIQFFSFNLMAAIIEMIYFCVNGCACDNIRILVRTFHALISSIANQ